MEPPVSQFDDPALKDALRRAIPRERAPDSLRQRILSLTTSAATESSGKPSLRLTDAPPAPPAAAPAAPPAAARMRIFSQRWLRLAAAAVFAIGAVITAVIINRGQRPDNPQYVIPTSVYRGMVKTHEERKLGTASADQVTSLASASTLSKQLGRSVFAPDLSKEGWSFQGGAIRQVASHPVAQLFFTRGQASLSVLSLPASAASSARDGESYDTTFQGTPIAGFVKGKGLFCIVGQSDDRSLTVEEVKRLLEAHRGELVKA